MVSEGVNGMVNRIAQYCLLFRVGNRQGNPHLLARRWDREVV